MDTAQPAQNQNQQSNAAYVNLNGSKITSGKSRLQVFFNYLKTFVIETILIVFLSSFILFTLNYFNLIPLSDIFPVFYALPKLQSQSSSFILGRNDDSYFFNSNYANLSACNPHLENNLSLNNLVSCSNPMIIKNIGKDVIFKLISNPFSPGENVQLQINIALKLIPGKGYKTGGIILGGGPNENRIFISYNSPSKTWGINVIYADKQTQYQPIYSVADNSVQRSFFSLLISTDGKQVSIISPNGLLQTFSLTGSLYSKDGSITATAAVGPDTELDIYSLNYLPSP